MTLRTRLALLFAVAVALLLSVGGAVLLHQLNTGLDSALDLSLTARADALAQQVGADGAVRDFQDGGGGGALLPPWATLAQVIGPSGTIVESSDGAGPRLLLTPEQLTAARTGTVAVTSTLPDGAAPGGQQEIRLLAMPVRDAVGASAAPAGPLPAPVVVVGTSREIGAAAVQRVRVSLLVAGPVLVALAGLGAALAATAALRPVERMRSQAAAISASDSTARLEVPARRDEVARLAETMNDLLGRLQQALSRQRAFVADAGHELRTPLTMLRAELELASRPGRDRQSLAAAVQAAAQDTERLLRLAESLLSLARADDPRLQLRREPVELDGMVAEALASAEAVAGARRVRICPQLAPVTVRGDPDRLRQVIDNLVENALRHSPDGSTITVTVQPVAPRTARLRVQDEGAGFPPEFLPRAFERFSRADSARGSAGGAGLGLAIVSALVTAHGGQVHADNGVGCGGIVVVDLPSADPASTEPHDTELHDTELHDTELPGPGSVG